MSGKDLVSVIDHFHLRNGSFFPLPIFLDVDDETKNRVKKHTTVPLIFENKVGNIIINDIYKIKKKSFCKKFLALIHYHTLVCGFFLIQKNGLLVVK